ncbi:MAG: hypothetical protein NW217_03125 [Hyphomicrobiaceae bacterium]|nr:hypothetical protein [Hyphomicrobiaceae bacterium]
MLSTQSFCPKARLDAQRAGPIACLALALMTSACAQSGLDVGFAPLGTPAGQFASTSPITTGSIASRDGQATAGPTTDGEGRAPAQTQATTPAERAVSSARNLRLAGNKAGALAQLDEAAAADPQNKVLLKERGFLALELGQTKRAEELLAQAHEPADPDWRTLSAWGAALAAQGRQAEAQAKLAEALRLAPDHPSVLNNLALSYALDGKRERAERLLRQASNTTGADARTKQNLALLLGLDGQSDEARRVGSDVLPPRAVAANVAYLEKLKAGTAQHSRRETAPPTRLTQARPGS